MIQGNYHERRKQASTAAKLVKEFLLDKFSHQCNYCGAKEDLQVDHVLSVAEGGSDDIDNLQILCGACNRKKGAKGNVWSETRRINSEGKILVRKEIWLEDDVIERLQAQADEEHMPLKAYMEKILIRVANNYYRIPHG